MDTISVNITVKKLADLKRIIAVIKQQKIESPVYLVNQGGAFHISFENDYGYTEIDTALEMLFEKYSCFDEISTGKTDIRIIICRQYINYLMEPVIAYKFFAVKPTKNEMDSKGGNKFLAWFKEEKKEYTVNIVPGINPVTKEEGFVITGDPQPETGERKVLVNELFNNYQSAFWRGFSMMRPVIQEEFEKHCKAVLKTRKKRK